MKSILKYLTKIVSLFILFVVFRFTIGNQIYSYLESNINIVDSIVYSQSGEVLSEIQVDKLAGSDILSNIKKETVTLNGGIGLQTSDSRILAMRKFLSDYNSPMAPYADVFITEADRYGLDWRLVASISGVESAFGNLIPRNSNNGWGWRGGPGGAYSIFESWGAGIKVITRGLARGYGVNMTPFQIERAYCPPCYANPAHAWANGVTRFMYELKYYHDNLDRL